MLLSNAVPVSGADLKDQIVAARERATALDRSVAQQEALIKQIDADQEATQAAIAATGRQLKSIVTDQRQVKRQIEKAEAALDRAIRRHDQLVDDLRQTDYTLGLLEQELASGQTSLTARRQALGHRLAEAYRAENTPMLEQLFTADSFSDALSDALAYLSYGDQDAQMAQAIGDDQRALDTLRLLTTATRLRTDQLRRAAITTQGLIRSHRAELNAEKRQLIRLEKRTKRVEASQKARYRNLAANKSRAHRLMLEAARAERALKARIAGLVRQAQSRAARKASPGGVRPGGGGFFSWPTSGTVTQGYGCTGYYLEPPKGSCPHFHDGIDIANGTGTPIRAAADGVIAFIGPGGGGAFVVVMGHAGGYETLYGHLLVRYVVHAGQFVKKGHVIGYMGCTGLCSGTHLHWEVVRNGVSLDPRAVL
jgi:murein DD-endopeptidase MepM/ murein hydrolase activator NlpD